MKEKLEQIKAEAVAKIQEADVPEKLYVLSSLEKKEN